jgi:hypothetical protein
MRVVLSTYGSRGDVEPMVGLAVQLQALGAEVRVCAPPEEEFRELLAHVGMPLVPAGPSVRQMVRQVRTPRSAGSSTRDVKGRPCSSTPPSSTVRATRVHAPSGSSSLCFSTVSVTVRVDPLRWSRRRVLSAPGSTVEPRLPPRWLRW